MSRHRTLVVACLLALTVTPFAAAAATPRHASLAGRLVTMTIPAPAGEIPSKWVNHPGLPKADVLLPSGYDPHRRYPLLLLLHGLGGNYQFFVQQGLLPEFYRLHAIVVMPDGGPSGWYADWWNNGQRSKPAWESYELDTVIPAVMARYPIRPQRRYHAIAGISMGGLGAAYLGGRLPGFFGTVASLSGFVDTQYLGQVVQPAMGIVSNGFLTDWAHQRDRAPDPIYGPPGGFYADGHNPTRLAGNLKDTRVFESTGTGIPNLASVGVIAAGEAEEIANGTWEEGGLIYPMSQRYHQALLDAGVNVTYEVHSGGHDLPAFHKEIRALLDWGLFRPVPTHPQSWTNHTVATTGQLWDVGYRFQTPPAALVRFHQAGRRLTISRAGSRVAITTRGNCTIHTPTPAVIHLPTHACG